MISEDIDDIKVSVAAIGYYLYRQAGCPYGDSLSGFTAWLDIQKQAWELLVEKENNETT